MLLIGNAPAKIPSACPQNALDLVRAQLKDPDSALFKSVAPIGGKDGGYCGWVNTKNSHGGYEGFSVFFVKADGKVVILSPDQSEPNLC